MIINDKLVVVGIIVIIRKRSQSVADKEWFRTEKIGTVPIFQ